MNREQARVEINRRLNILSQKKVPEITKVMLRGGLQNINQRKEIGRFRKEIEARKNKLSERLSEINRVNLLSAFEDGNGQDIEPEIILSTFHEPKLRNVKIGRFNWF